jgi:hypothetical protein
MPDLQHPPEKLPELIEPVESGRAEFAIGSRYVPGGSTAERWGPFRKLNSWVATVLARPFAGRTRDPMSGFFALRRSTFERGERLTPLGYKIGLELMCKCRVASVAEVPIHFDMRAAGESKLTLRQQFRYLEHLSRLYDFCYPRLSPIAKFLIATAFGWLVGARGRTSCCCTRRPARRRDPGRVPGDDRGHARVPRPVRADAAEVPADPHAVAGLRDRRPRRVRRLHADRRVPAEPRVADPRGELFVLTFGAATVARYVLRKELMQDIRGLRRELRAEEVGAP